MGENNRSDQSRRQFMEFLLASPLFSYVAVPGLASGQRLGAGELEGHLADKFEITSADQALNVFDLEEVARRNLPPAHHAYLATGVEADATLRANREGFAKFQIRPRRMVDTSRIEARVELFGTTWPTPIVLAPVSSLCAFHPEGELAAAKAARTRNHLQVLSTLSTKSVEDVIAARGTPVWFQLYPTSDWAITRALVKRAEAAGCPVVAVTVDNPTTSGRESFVRGKRLDSRDCGACHAAGPGYDFRRKPMFDRIDTSKLVTPLAANLTWDFVRRLQDITSMKVVLKGIVTAEEAALALQHRVSIGASKF